MMRNKWKEWGALFADKPEWMANNREIVRVEVQEIWNNLGLTTISTIRRAIFNRSKHAVNHG